MTGRRTLRAAVASRLERETAYRAGVKHETTPHLKKAPDTIFSRIPDRGHG